MNPSSNNEQQDNPNPNNIASEIQRDESKTKMKFFEKIPKTLFTSIAVFTLVLPVLMVMILSFSKNSISSSTVSTPNPNYQTILDYCKENNQTQDQDTCIKQMSKNNSIKQYNTKPSIWIFAIPSFLLIISTSLLLVYAKSKIGFKSSWLILAISYNSLIILVKFLISPSTLYSANITVTQGFLTLNFDPSSSISNFFTAVSILILYSLVMLWVYSFFRRRFRAKMKNIGIDMNAEKQKIKKSKKLRTLILIVILGSIVGAGIPIFILFAVIGGVGGSAIGYLGYIGSVILLPILLALIFFICAFQSSYKQSIETRNVIFMSSFFTLAFLLILSIHIIWVVFLVLISTLWPFNITYYSSK
jgi:hypothetical protein